MHPHRSSALGYASAASAAHSRLYGACAAEAAASETSGLRAWAERCPRAWRDPDPRVQYACPTATHLNKRTFHSHTFRESTMYSKRNIE